jgi:hypothetical protein
MCRDVEVATPRRRGIQREPRNALVLHRSIAIRIDANLVSAPDEFARTTDNARLRAAQRATFQISTVVMSRRVRNDNTWH